LLAFADAGIRELIAAQKKALGVKCARGVKQST
jgi:hypothetical protein